MKVVITDHQFDSIEHERAVLLPAGVEVVVAQCRNESEVIQAAGDADALLVQFAPITAAVAEQLSRCRIIVRYGIGLDNIDITAASRRGIAVCNIPDYGTNEVAEHAIALALALARQLPQVDRRLRQGTWKITPDAAVWPFSELTFATLGFGRIARAVHEKIGGLGFRRIAHDPLIPPAAFGEGGVEPVTFEELLRRTDVLSLHLPLAAQTRHILDTASLAKLKRTAIIVNTARGGLIDGDALARALSGGLIGGAGLDVYETEPIEATNPLFGCPNTILTSHTAWYSLGSVPRLQRTAAEEALRGLRTEALKYKVN